MAMTMVFEAMRAWAVALANAAGVLALGVSMALRSIVSICEEDNAAVVLGFGFGVGDGHLVVYITHARNITAAQGHLFLGSLGGGGARHGHFACVKCNFHIAHAQILGADVLLDGCTCCSVQVLRGGSGVLASKQFFTGFLDKAEQSH